MTIIHLQLDVFYPHLCHLTTHAAVHFPLRPSFNSYPVSFFSWLFGEKVASDAGEVVFAKWRGLGSPQRVVSPDTLTSWAETMRHHQSRSPHFQDLSLVYSTKTKTATELHQEFECG